MKLGRDLPARFARFAGVGMDGNLAERRFKWENQTGQMLIAAKCC
jgi:hypothetical protein